MEILSRPLRDRLVICIRVSNLVTLVTRRGLTQSRICLINLWRPAGAFGRLDIVVVELS